jgi:hypothetical protein
MIIHTHSRPRNSILVSKEHDQVQAYGRISGMIRSGNDIWSVLGSHATEGPLSSGSRVAPIGTVANDLARGAIVRLPNSSYMTTSKRGAQGDTRRERPEDSDLGGKVWPMEPGRGGC